MTYQSVLLEMWHSTIENQDRFNAVKQQLAKPVEKHQKMGMWHWVTLAIPHALDSLMKPQADIYSTARNKQTKKIPLLHK